MKKDIFNLKLYINKEPYPHHEEQGSEGNWAHIKLDIVKGERVVYNIVDVRWYPLELLEWFFVNKHKLLNDELKLLGEESIAELICNYYETDSCYVKVDYLLGYRMTHCLGYGLQGLDHLEAYLGKNKLGYEFSLKTEEMNIQYQIDLPQFFEGLEELVKEW